MLQFVGDVGAAKDYVFKIRQTYSDGTVVDWTGATGSDTPAPKVEAKSSLGGGGSSTLATIAFVLAVAGARRRGDRAAAEGGRGERPGVIRRVVAATLVLLFALPSASAFAHAALVRTVPSAAGIVTPAPKEVSLTFSEPIEPRFAAVSISDANGKPVNDGNPQRKAGDATSITIPLKTLPEGWYLVYWRVISVDGHPVRGAFTFAVGPNAGPAPQFVVPSISETAATPRLVAARWLTILAAMVAIGLFVLRMLIARPVRHGLRAVSVACGVAVLIALVAAPVYLLLATAQFSLRSAFDLSALTPLLDVSAFGRGYLRLELCLALFAGAAAIAIAIDRPERARRSVAELLATTGALLAAASVLLIPGVSGHPSQTSPRGLAVALDVIHLSAGSVWIGGLIGLLVLWRALPQARRLAGLTIAVPRFSNVAVGAVVALIATGVIASILQLPTLSSLWQTGYGQALLVKIGLLCVALLIAAVNLLRTRPRCSPSRRRRRSCCGGWSPARPWWSPARSSRRRC